MVFPLAVLTAAVGYAVVMHGGDDPVQSNVTLLLVSVAALAGSLIRPGTVVSTSRDRAIAVAALLLPVYVAFQLLPLPLTALQVLSPNRAELARALESVGAGSWFAPITISPPTTWMHLLRGAGLSLTFVTIYRLAARSGWHGWLAAVPVIAIGVLEALWALAGNSVASGQMSGSYYSKNHFAGLLEMTLPFTAVLALVMLGRARTRHGLSTGAAIGASILLAGAVATFIAITSSLSKGGALACFMSLLVMGLLYAGRRLSGHIRIAAFAALIVAALLFFVFITPTTLVQQFAVVASDDQSEGRLPIWQNTLQLVSAYPVVGIGLGNFYPGLLQYQTYGNGLAWVNTHNDYLQLLAELGFVGWVIPIGLVVAALARAVRAAVAVSTGEGQLLGLACTGALLAFALHALVDFNSYILANALVLAWVSGIASALRPSEAPALDVSPHRTPFRGLRAAVMTLAAGLMVWTVASLLFLQKYRDNPGVERIFCRFGICDTVAAVAARSSKESQVSSSPILPEVLAEYLRRDPADPSRWQELGVAYQSIGRIDAARFCFDRAVALGPNSPPILLMAASFHLEVGEHAQAFQLMSRSLSAGAQFDEAAFGDLEVRQIDVEEILNSGMFDRRSSTAYLRELISTGNVPYAERTWRWLLDHKFAEDRLACQYIEFLIVAKKSDKAFEDWAVYAAGRSPGYPDSNRLFNGDFEAEPSGCRFDWEVKPAAGVAISFDREVAYSGGRSLRLQFDGTANPSEIGVRQTVFLKPGRYRLSGYVRTKELSTDEGVGLRVADATGASPLSVTTTRLLGTNGWTRVESVFDAPSSGGLVTVSVTRKPTLKFDNRLRGTSWIDQMGVSEVRGFTRSP